MVATKYNVIVSLTLSLCNNISSTQLTLSCSLLLKLTLFLQLVITKGYGVRATTIGNPSAFAPT